MGGELGWEWAGVLSGEAEEVSHFLSPVLESRVARFLSRGGRGESQGRRPESGLGLPWPPRDSQGKTAQVHLALVRSQIHRGR